ncbi:hypothetical protein ACIPEL_16215 [Streptomyces griseoviridis]
MDMVLGDKLRFAAEVGAQGFWSVELASRAQHSAGGLPALAFYEALGAPPPEATEALSRDGPVPVMFSRSGNRSRADLFYQISP